MATIAQDKSIQHRSEVSITVYVKGLDSAYSRSDRYIEFYDAWGDYLGKTTVDAYASVSDTVTLTDSSWEADSNYIISGIAYYTDNGIWKSSSLGTVYLTAIAPSSGGGTDPEEPEPDPEEELDKFYWINRYTDITSGDDFSDIVTADKWNELVKLLSTLLDKTNEEWYTEDNEGNILYSSISKCRVDEGDTVTVKIYNSIRFNIGSRYGTGINLTTMPIAKGKTIYPQHFNGLQDAINNWVDDYNDSL